MSDMDYLMPLFSMTLKSSAPLAMTPPAGNRCEERTLLRALPHPFMGFCFLHMLQHQGAFVPSIPTCYLGPEGIRRLYETEVLDRSGMAREAEVWPLLEPLGVAWETVEEVARTRLPGYMFVSRLMSLDDADEFHSPITLCTDPALTAMVLSRIKGRFYRSDSEPNYQIDHFLKTAVVCGDSRLFDRFTSHCQENKS